MKINLSRCKYCGEELVFAKSHICINFKDKPKLVPFRGVTRTRNKNIYK